MLDRAGIRKARRRLRQRGAEAEVVLGAWTLRVSKAAMREFLDEVDATIEEDPWHESLERYTLSSNAYGVTLYSSDAC